MEYLAQHIEGLIFTSEQPLSVNDILDCLEATFETTLDPKEIKSAIKGLINKYKAEEFAFEILSISGGYQFLTKGAYHKSIGTLLKQTTKKRLSRAALETLSIIAYKQPVTKTEMEKIRGVSCDYAVQKLLEKELVTITGRSEGPGRPLLYGTSERFMDYFGISDLAELPKPKDFKMVENEVGEAAPIEESMIQEVEPGSEGLTAVGTIPPGDQVLVPGDEISEVVYNIAAALNVLDPVELPEQPLAEGNIADEEALPELKEVPMISKEELVKMNASSEEEE